MSMAGTGRPRRACFQCNSQKLRCSGERPNCQRCLHLGRFCVYGTRAAVRERARSQTQAQHPTQAVMLNHTLPVAVRSLTPHITAATSGYSFRRATPPPPSMSQLSAPLENAYLGIPPPLLAELTAIYFTHVYNASLLLHKSRFMQDVASRTVRSHVLLSVCALASNFYRRDRDSSSLKQYGFGLEWAEQATKLVLQEADEPCDENIITFLNISLFWYSQGSWRRASIHKGSGIQTAHVLGLVFEQNRIENALDREIQRRRFWACHLANLFASETCFLTEPTELILKLTLPCHDDDYEAGNPKEGSQLNADSSNGSIYAELIQAMTLWSAVHEFIKTPRSDPSIRMVALQALDARISKWWSNLPASLALTPTIVPTTSVGLLPRLLLVHIVYHQCLCALHSSIVPLFTSSEIDGSWGYTLQLSAQVAFEHSGVTCTLLEATLSHLGDASMVASFVAYAAYCACAIQIPFLFCQRTDVRRTAQVSVRAGLKMINNLGKFWKFASLLDLHVRQLYHGHARNPTPIDNEPKYADVNKLKNFKSIAIHARESILGHTQILWGDKGAFAKQGEELTDLGANPDSSQGLLDAPWGISSSDPHGAAPFVQPVDDFQPYLDPRIFNTDTSFLAFEQFDAGAQLDDTELWLGLGHQFNS